MITRAEAAGVPFRWVAADSVYGIGEIERDLRRSGKGYVLGVGATHVFQSWDKPRSIAWTAADITTTLQSSDWNRLSAGEGTKGPRLHDWCYLELADLEASEFNEASRGLWTRGILIRRTIADGDLAYFTTWCPTGTPVETLVNVEGHRWRLKIGSRLPRTSLVWTIETRSWHGWHRHVSIVMLAFAMMAIIQHQTNKSRKKTTPTRRRRQPASSAGRSRKSVG